MLEWSCLLSCQKHSEPGCWPTTSLPKHQLPSRSQTQACNFGNPPEPLLRELASSTCLTLLWSNGKCDSLLNLRLKLEKKVHRNTEEWLFPCNALLSVTTLSSCPSRTFANSQKCEHLWSDYATSGCLTRPCDPPLHPCSNNHSQQYLCNYITTSPVTCG